MSQNPQCKLNLNRNWKKGEKRKSQPAISLLICILLIIVIIIIIIITTCAVLYQLFRPKLPSINVRLICSIFLQNSTWMMQDVLLKKCVLKVSFTVRPMKS